MNIDEKLAEMTLAIQQLTQRMISIAQNEEKLTNLKPLFPCKTMTTPTKQNKARYVLTKRDCHEGVQNGKGSRHLIMKKTNEEQDQQHNKALKTLEGKTVDLELIKPTTVDDIEMNKLCLKNPSTYCDENDFQFKEDKKTSCIVNKSECYKGFQNGRKSVHLFTKEISEDQAQQQTKALESLEDEALDTELIKAIPIDDVELNELHLENSSECCEMNGFYFMEDTIIDIPLGCRYHTGVQQQAVGKLQQ